jgi:predicted metal-dependent phosphoesterase TrpH
VIDLHTHTTASDGRCTPPELVARASAAGVTVLAVTDHDTVAGCEAAELACAAAGVEFVAGIEITAVRGGADVHVLGYFFDRRSPVLQSFLAEQRQRRIDRVRQIVDRLATLGVRLDADAILAPGLDDPGKAAGRPWVARALVAGGHVKNTNMAFEIWLARGRPAFVPRLAASPAEVFERLHAAGGIASLAHPGLNGRDDWLSEFAASGLDALEVYHTEHPADAVARYREAARRLDLAISGGSDFHGDASHGAGRPGTVSLPREDYDNLRATSRATASGSNTSS